MQNQTLNSEFYVEGMDRVVLVPHDHPCRFIEDLDHPIEQDANLIIFEMRETSQCGRRHKDYYRVEKCREGENGIFESLDDISGWRYRKDYQVDASAIKIVPITVTPDTLTKTVFDQLFEKPLSGNGGTPWGVVETDTGNFLVWVSSDRDLYKQRLVDADPSLPVITLKQAAPGDLLPA